MVQLQGVAVVEGTKEEKEALIKVNSENSRLLNWEKVYITM